MKFPIDITQELRGARTSRRRKLRFANYGVAAAAGLVGMHYGMMIASARQPMAALISLCLLLWGTWGFWFITSNR